MVVLDTSVVIDHLRQQPGTETLLAKINKLEGRDYLSISVITLQELYEGQSTKNNSKLKDMLAVLSPFKILEYNSETAKLAGEIARDSKKSIEFADAAIAATCVFNDFKLLTINQKHFQDISDLVLYNLVS